MKTKTFLSAVLSISFLVFMSLSAFADRIATEAPPISTSNLLSLAHHPTMAKADKVIHDSLPFLSEDEVSEFEKAVYLAVEQNPKLVSDGKKLLIDLKDSWDSGYSQHTLFQAELRYINELRPAAVAVDPPVGNIFDIVVAKYNQAIDRYAK